jgi:hypothetical protein
LGKVRPCDRHKLAISLKLRKACGLDDIPNECPKHLPKRPQVRSTHLFNNCLRLSHFAKPWKEAKVITLLKPGKDPKVAQNLRSNSLFSTIGKLFEEVILKIVHRDTKERDLLNASQFGSRARHSMTLQCMKLQEHVILKFNNIMSIAAVFLDIEKIFNTTWPSWLAI